MVDKCCKFAYLFLSVCSVWVWIILYLYTSRTCGFIGGSCFYCIYFLWSNIYTSQDGQCKSGLHAEFYWSMQLKFAAIQLDLNSFCQPGIHIFFCLWICVCSSISRRVAFSREIWRAIYRSLPEHQAWCCCCCSYLSLLLTIPASVSVRLHLYLLTFVFFFSLFSDPTFSWCIPFLQFYSSFPYLSSIACFGVNYWSEQKGVDCFGLRLGIAAWLTSL